MYFSASVCMSLTSDDDIRADSILETDPTRVTIGKNTATQYTNSKTENSKLMTDNLVLLPNDINSWPTGKIMKKTVLSIQPTAAFTKKSKKSVEIVSPRNESKISNLVETTEGTPPSTKNLKEQQQEPRETSKEEASTVLGRTFTNVAFPRGFTTSQCVLLASRQRMSNYLYSTAGDRREILSNGKGQWEQAKSLEKKRALVTKSNARDLKPPLRKSHGNEGKGSHSPGYRLPSKPGNKTIVNEKTGLTGYLKWKSKEDIARYLAAHANARLLWIPESEEANIMTSCDSRRDLSVGRNMNWKRLRFPPHSPVYLFEKDLKKTV